MAGIHHAGRRFPVVLVLSGILFASIGLPPEPRVWAESGHSQLTSDDPWTPPPWTELGAGPRRDVLRYADSTAYEAARRDPDFETRRWVYRSDSLDVVALALVPREASPRPAIVYCRGSYIQQDMAPSFLPLLHRLGRAGYVVVAPQYRGSEGGEGRDEMGGADVEDVLAAVRLVAARPEVRGDEIYLYGESRGGMMAFQAIRDGAAVRAAATVGAFTDLDSLFHDDERAAAMAPGLWPEYEMHSAEILDRRSAIRWADRLQVPLLLLHGASDGQVRPAHSQWLNAALDAHGPPHKMLIVPDGSHTLGEQSAFRDSVVLDWFHQHAH